ncbi:hypothetical protein [Mesorhizobium sp. f-mel]
MTIARVEVITSVQRRRRWWRAEKERLVAATFEPGVTVSEDSQYRVPLRQLTCDFSQISREALGITALTPFAAESVSVTFR